MRRTLVQIDEDTYLKLRQRAFREERSISAVVRELLANGLRSAEGRGKPTSVGQFTSVRVGRSKQRDAAVSEHHDEALTSAFDR